MEITKDEKEALKALRSSPGYVVLCKLEDDFASRLGKRLLESDLSNPQDVKIIEDNKLYLQARKDFLKNIESHTREIVEPVKVSS